MTLIPSVNHEAEEEMLIFEVVIAAHMYDMQVFDEGTSQRDSLYAIGRKLLANKPSSQL